MSFELGTFKNLQTLGTEFRIKGEGKASIPALPLRSFFQIPLWVFRAELARAENALVLAAQKATVIMNHFNGIFIILSLNISENCFQIPVRFFFAISQP